MTTNDVVQLDGAALLPRSSLSVWGGSVLLLCQPRARQVQEISSEKH